MTLNRIVNIFLIATIIALFNPGFSRAEYDYIDINNPLLRKIPLAIPLCSAMSGSQAEFNMSRLVSDYLVETLNFTGYFIMLNRDSFYKKSFGDKKSGGEKIVLIGNDFTKWLDLGVELLITGGVSIKNDFLEVELRLYDIYRKTLLIGKRYKGKKNDYRKMTRRFCGDVIYRLTGSRWLFDTKIAFVSTTTGKKEIYICDFGGQKPKRFTFSKSITLSPAWSSDGNWLAYTSYKRGNPDIYVKHLKEKRGSVISKKGINAFPDWMPGKFAFAATMSYSGDTEIYLLTGDGKIVKRLTNAPGIDVSPSWSPDGQHFAFVSNRSGTPQVYIKNIKSNRVKRLTFKGKYNSSPDWSPKGDKIAFTGLVNGKFNIFVIGVHGGKAAQLTHNNGNNEFPSWSPDASHIAFSSSRSGQYKIYVMTAFGNGQRRLATLPGEQTNPAWSPIIRKN